MPSGCLVVDIRKLHENLLLRGRKRKRHGLVAICRVHAGLQLLSIVPCSHTCNLFLRISGSLNVPCDL